MDLHIHSAYSSDGTFGVHELFRQAVENHMKVIVIADHDTWESWDEASEESVKTGIETIPALELSCIDENRMVHILGYGIDRKQNSRLSDIVSRIQQSRIEILPMIKKNLEEAGFYVDMDKVYELAAPHPPVITNFANAILLDPANEENEALLPYRLGGEKSDRPYIRFIKDYLVAGKKCYVPEYIVDIYSGIQVIREAKGVPVLAHPGEWFSERDEEKVPDMIKAGLQGIEVYTPYHSEEKICYFDRLAEQYGLFKTAGSDYHDSRKKPGHLMGMVEHADMEMFYKLKQIMISNQTEKTSER